MLRCWGLEMAMAWNPGTLVKYSAPKRLQLWYHRTKRVIYSSELLTYRRLSNIVNIHNPCCWGHIPSTIKKYWIGLLWKIYRRPISNSWQKYVKNMGFLLMFPNQSSEKTTQLLAVPVRYAWASIPVATCRWWAPRASPLSTEKTPNGPRENGGCKNLTISSCFSIYISEHLLENTLLFVKMLDLEVIQNLICCSYCIVGRSHGSSKTIWGVPF